VGVCVEHATRGQLVIAEIDEQNRKNRIRLLAHPSQKRIIVVIDRLPTPFPASNAILSRNYAISKSNPEIVVGLTHSLVGQRWPRCLCTLYNTKHAVLRRATPLIR
jgi:hypothetical protein